MRLTAAVLAIAAAAVAIAGIAVSADVYAAVRAEVAVAGENRVLDVRRIRIVDSLTPGGRYRLPAFGVRNHRGIRTSFRLVVSNGAPEAERLPPERWLRLFPTAVVIDAGRSRAVGMRLQLPNDAKPGRYGVVLGVRPGGGEGALLTFRIEPGESAGASLRRAATLATWLVPAVIAAVLVVFLERGRHTGSKRLKSLRSTVPVRRDH
jgi:hypothetical protein